MFNEYPQNDNVGAKRIRPKTSTWISWCIRGVCDTPLQVIGEMRTFIFCFILELQMYKKDWNIRIHRRIKPDKTCPALFYTLRNYRLFI